MVKMCELSKQKRKEIVHTISWVMFFQYHIDKESIDEFWDTVEIGVEARRRA